jgi:hypothetical protein
LSHSERLQKIENYGVYHKNFRDFLKEFPREMWNYKPDADHWSVHEIILHLLDTEMNAYVRYRICVAEPGKTITPFDQDKWSRELKYQERNVEEAIHGLQWVIQMNYELLKSLPEEAFSRSVIHPERGVQSLDQAVTVYFNHIPHHIEQMRKRLKEWKKLKS